MLGLVVLLSACSSLRLGYQQLPRLASWWVDDFVDLDRTQQTLFDKAWLQLQQWHRREELPRLQALLSEAEQRLQAGTLDARELAALEAGFAQSVERTLVHAAPLAAPLLASFTPAQWAALRQAMDDKQARWWRDQQASDDQRRRAREKGFVRSLDRWLGGLSRAQETLARERASRWPVDRDAWRQQRVARQAEAVAGLRHWAAGEAALGVQHLMRAANQVPSVRTPAEQALRDAVAADALAVMALADTSRRRETQRRWADWREELGRIHHGR
jgi:hypothetical protein